MRRTARSELPRWQRRIGEGRFQLGLSAAAAFFSLLSGGEAYFEHRRGSFNWWPMWTPVWVTPPMLGAAVAAFSSRKAARWLLPAMSAANLVEGLVGFALHLRGVRRMPGHFSNLLFNIAMGPPLFAPLLFSGVGLLGLLASVLRREDER